MCPISFSFPAQASENLGETWERFISGGPVQAGVEGAESQSRRSKEEKQLVLHCSWAGFSVGHPGSEPHAADFQTPTTPISSDSCCHIRNLFLLKLKISTERNRSHILAKEKNKTHFTNFFFTRPMLKCQIM